jgi:type II secretion system protein N
MKTRLKTSMFMTLYVLLMVIVFLLVTFPYDKLQARILSDVSRMTGWTIVADKWTLAWPIGLEWRDVSLAAGSSRAHLDRVLVTLRPASLLQGRPTFVGRIENGEGSPNGTPGYVMGSGTFRSWSQPALIRLTGMADRFDLGKLGLPIMKRGLLKGEFDQRWTEAGEGHWQVEFTDLQLETVPIGPATLPSLRFANLKGRAQCHEGLCRIESLAGTGPDGSLSASGTLGPRTPPVLSELALSLSVTVSPEFAQRASSSGMALAVPGLSLNVNLKGPVSNLQLAL